MNKKLKLKNIIIILVLVIITVGVGLYIADKSLQKSSQGQEEYKKERIEYYNGNQKNNVKQ